MSPETAIFWIGTLAGFSILIQTIEYLEIRNVFSEKGVWQWSLLQNEFSPTARKILNPFMQDKGFLALLWIRLAAALMLIAGVGPTSGIALLLLITTLLIGIRCRGTFNGGSDFMTGVVLVGLLFAGLGGLWYIGVQLTLSYAVAGFAKAKNPDWLRGTALSQMLDSGHGPATGLLVRKLIGSQKLSQAFSWIVLVFECAFPIVWLKPSWLFGFLCFGIAFHLANFLIFGLNRFFWAWISAYPALIFCVSSFR